MTQRRVQHFQRNQSPDKWSAEALNAIADAAEMILNMTVEPPLLMNQTNNRLALSLAPGQSIPRLDLAGPHKVAIVEAPVAGKLIKVRIVRYSTDPPEHCTGDGPVTCKYSWASDPLEAYPELGQKSQNYASFVWTEETPKFETRLLTYRREFGYWVVEMPASGSAASIVLVHGPGIGTNWNALPTDNYDFVRVIHMSKNPAYVAGNVLPQFIWSGLPADPQGFSIVQCWPGTKQADWQYFLSTDQGYPPAPTPTNPVYLSTKMIGGVEYICPEVFAEAGTPDGGTLAGDC